MQDIIPWRDSRKLLYWRLRRLLRQNQQERRVQAAGGAIDQGAAAATLRRWFTEDQGATQWSTITRWCATGSSRRPLDEASVLERNLQAIKQDTVLHTVNSLVLELTPSQRAEFIRKLSALEMEQ
ncbi:hypothetical protein ACJJTC_019175 [Scirpophaga incertulas]